MRKASIALILIPVALGGCSLFGDKDRQLDEFAVARNAPLIIPPDYTLEPPAPGTISTSAQTAQAQAVETLFGSPAPRSETERKILDDAGRDRAILGARSVAGDPDTRVVDKGAETQTIIAAPEGDTADATAQPPQ